MYASQFISDAAVSRPQHPRSGYDLQPSDDKPAESRKQGLIATLRGFIDAHAPVGHSSARAR
jgi:hypothetical protein